MKIVLTILFLFVGASVFSQTKTFEYDDVQRLIKAHYWEAANKKFTVNYTYDEVGNRLTKVVEVFCPSSQTITELVNSGAVVRQSSGTLILQNTSYTGTATGQIGGNSSVTLLPNTLIDSGTTFIINTDGCPN